MILAVNIGNTNIAAGICRDGSIHQISLPTGSLSAGAELRGLLEDRLKALGESPGAIEGSVLSSVVPHKTRLVGDAIRDFTGMPPWVVDEFSQTGLDITAYGSDLLGVDRVVCCVSALEKYPPPLVVFDLGTATTANVLDSAGAFLGGAILPGVRMGLEALAAGTSQLPQLKAYGHPPLIGRDTRQCLAAGAVYGAAFAIEGFTRRIEEELGQKVTAVVTGGNAPQVIPCCKRAPYYEPTLLLEGLALLHQRHGPTNGKGDQRAINQS